VNLARKLPTQLEQFPRPPNFLQHLPQKQGFRALNDPNANIHKLIPNSEFNTKPEINSSKSSLKYLEVKCCGQK